MKLPSYMQTLVNGFNSRRIVHQIELVKHKKEEHYEVIIPHPENLNSLGAAPSEIQEPIALNNQTDIDKLAERIKSLRNKPIRPAYYGVMVHADELTDSVITPLVYDLLEPHLHEIDVLVGSGISSNKLKEIAKRTQKRFVTSIEIPRETIVCVRRKPQILKEVK